MEQVAEHVQRERGFAQPAEALEHEHALALAQLAAQAVQLGAAADEAGRQDPPGAGVEERARGTSAPGRGQPGGTGGLRGWSAPR